jgi:SHS2 domain-containing protein
MPEPRVRSPQERRWEHYSHGADVGIRGFGASIAQAFEAIGLALTSTITDLAKVVPAERVKIHCEAPGPDDLLYEWVNALVYEMSTRGVLFARFEVEISGSGLSGEAWGEPLDSARHQPAVEVKGATYTDLSVAEGPPGTWVAQCIVDV